MAVDRAVLKAKLAAMATEDREALAEELGLARDTSKGDILKALEELTGRVKKLETPDKPADKKAEGTSLLDDVLSIFK